MRNDRLFSGLVLVIIGAVFLLNSFNVIDFNWWNLFRLWPIFLVIGGVNLLLSNTKAVWATVVKVAVLLIGVGFLLFANTKHYNHSRPFWHFNFKDDDDGIEFSDGDIKERKGDSVVYQQKYNDEKYVHLNIAGGATSYKLESASDSLFKALTYQSFGDYSFTMSKDDSLTTLNFNMKGHNNKFHWDSDHMNEARLSLSPIPVWDIELKGGAAEVDFDFTKFKIRSVEINGGATSSKIRMGATVPVSTLSVNAGASEVEIWVPKNAGCDIDMRGGLTSKSFDDFTKVSGNHYVTPDFDKATNKIYLKFRGGVSDFKVKRY
ncbi:LiaI-LiaF-like domain-containing protein [Mucilaginibacter terrae]|uniref:LiaI-LiaF-like transmembrane region domain-containing protein n=1 Tax=Mucilaginibacter terrae TaxID=1955052 RepID=A0ABU3GXW9_9SPHI|nr:DUF5668 domain-containing protein [Mucilaginibacter terrae]MDT3404613.1 hypothetical protein [Mucilaginibacter terrae]